MFLEHKESGNLVEVLQVNSVWDPCENQVLGRFHAGEELQEPKPFPKENLCFPSGEALPLCWLDPEYQLSQN